MSNARETLHLRNTLNAALTYDELRGINWQAVANAATDAIERGWTGEELARMCIGDLGKDAETPGAIILTTLRTLGQQEPPGRTPTPAQYDDADRRARIANAATPEQVQYWANHIRQTIANTPTHGTNRG